MAINNEMYCHEDFLWWAEGGDHPSHFLRYVINPIRFGYFRQVLLEEFPDLASNSKLIDVGCGGGFLAEEFGRMGLQVTGIDPSASALDQAARHAEENRLSLVYTKGCGEKLPFENGTFDIAACCDVLEHVDDVGCVIKEIARILKTGGVFFFDTITRSWFSKLMAIKIAQEWKWSAWEEQGSHVWEKFIRPEELTEGMKRHGLFRQEIKGISSGGNPLADLVNVRRRAKWKISRRELGQRMRFHVSDNLAVSYMGYAIKK